MKNKSINLKFIKPHLGKSSGRLIKSIYTKDGSYLNKISAVRTVGEAKQLLNQLPDSLPLNFQSGQYEEDNKNGYKPVWFNVGQDREHLQFAENYGVRDD